MSRGVGGESWIIHAGELIAGQTLTSPQVRNWAFVCSDGDMRGSWREGVQVWR